MATRALWKGSISFGLIFVPVKVYAATEPKDIKFNYLHKDCSTPVRYQRYCPHCEREVLPEEIVRAHQYRKGEYVVMEEDDLAALPQGPGHTIEIMNFVNLADIDPVYYYRAYYLAPDQGGQKVYELLFKTMEQTGKVAIARSSLRSKESLTAVRALEKGLAMHMMFFPDELRAQESLEEMHYQVDIGEKELKMAVDLVQSLSEDFVPERYQSNYRKALMEIIQAKVEGRELAVPAGKEAGKVVDLMEALKASIEQARRQRA